jgi:sugar-phosphatase
MPTLYCDAILFDLDGVLVDSEAVVARHWKRWAREHGLDPEEVLANAHGQRVIETVRKYLPGLPAEEQQAKADKLAYEEGSDLDGVVAFGGASDLLRSLPPERWAVATSGTRHTATGRFGTLGLEVPHAFVTADDVAKGKPDPEPYRRAAYALGRDPARCVVFEDSPAGVTAALAAGAQVVGIVTTHSADDLAHATHVVQRLGDIRIEPAHPEDGGALAVRVEAAR